ncbi:S9 family peptidase [Paenibacillus popilliae]|uniref:Dipeptidyl aminopeptidase/acylaminoacyl-peptidase n=1 Tax=Paenibacillus popilliae ATCC 14706 TaxID=1212764 RepID=M9LG62_PAEPP|nr:dipeptidyl aminopeptidase/acylaminoacyl-peptidase [Paenibacillus popilliae ATCC 14706]
MKQNIVAAVLAAVMACSMPLTVMGAETGSAAPWYAHGVKSLVRAGAIDAKADLTAKVTVNDFIRFAVTMLTYKHGVDPKKVAQEEGWIQEGELANPGDAIMRGEAARIIVRASGQDSEESSLIGYAEQAKSLGLLHGYRDGSLRADEALTIREAAVALDNVKQMHLDSIDDKGIAPIPVEDFMRSPDSLDYKLSSDGTYLTYMAPWENRANVFVKNMGGSGEPERVTSSKDRDIAAFFWKEDTILYAKDNGGDESFHIYSSSFNGAQEKDLTPYTGVRAGLVSLLVGIKDEILVILNKENKAVFDVYRLNIKTGALQLVAKNPGNVQKWLADRNGNIRMAIVLNGYVYEIVYRASDKEEFRPFLKLNEGAVHLLGFTQDNQSVLAVSSQGRDKAALVRFDLQANEQVLFEHPEVDIANALYDSRRGRLLYAAYVTDKKHLKFFDSEFEGLYRKLMAKLNVNESEIGISGYNQDMNKFIVNVSNDKTSGRHYYYDVTTEQLTELANPSPWLKPELMADMHPISYQSRDGLIIHGYLTLPKYKKPENLPLIVHPHGGPWSRDMWGFNSEVQLLANRGYAVLQVNFRASTGYGKRFQIAGNKQWGRDIQNDITDGVQWAIKQGIADPGRIGIYGFSFGGYAALAGIAFTPDLYAAAVDYAGVSNIFTLLKTVPPYWLAFRNILYELIGHPEQDKELLRAVSPIFHVDRIKTPLFVAQGANDPRVNQAESDQIVEALKKRGVDVQYMLKDNEGHGFNNEENRIEFYNAMIEFFDDHLRNKDASVKAAPLL